MIESHEPSSSMPFDQSPESSGSSFSPDYMGQARHAYEHEDFTLALHLYLAAFEHALEHEGARSDNAQTALHFAWELACVLRERSIAEYVFEKLEPFLSDDDVMAYSVRLQDLALDKLSELGISRDDLEEITGMISDELGALPHVGKVTPIVKSVRVSSDASAASSQLMQKLEAGEDVSDLLPEGVSVVGFGSMPQSGAHVAAFTKSAEAQASSEPSVTHIVSTNALSSDTSTEAPVAPAMDIVSQDIADTTETAVSDTSSVSAESGDTGYVATDADASSLSSDASQTATAGQDISTASSSDTIAPAVLNEAVAQTKQDIRDFVERSVQAKGAKSAPKMNDMASHPHKITYADIVGFDSVIEDARSYGIGVKNDPELSRLADELCERLGIDALTSFGSLVFRTSSREDASFFMGVTVGELGLPAMRVQVQPGPGGIPVLAVSVSADKPSRGHASRPQLDVPSVLILEDIDVWGPTLLNTAAMMDSSEAMNNPIQQAASRGVREALTLIHTAIENPDVCVLASMVSDSDDQGYVYDLLEPMNIIDIFMPDELERRAVWQRIAMDHPSIEALDISLLTKMSRHMSRMEIISAARETLEEAYRLSLRQRRFVPVTQEMVCSHLANYQSLDSSEYKELEDLVIESFGKSLDEDLQDLMNGGE